MQPIDLFFITGGLAVLYFVLVRPQAQEAAKQEKLIASLARGDRVVTASGVHGVISSVAEETVQLEVAEKTRITVDKATIAKRLSEGKVE